MTLSLPALSRVEFWVMSARGDFPLGAVEWNGGERVLVLAGDDYCPLGCERPCEECA